MGESALGGRLSMRLNEMGTGVGEGGEKKKAEEESKADSALVRTKEMERGREGERGGEEGGPAETETDRDG